MVKRLVERVALRQHAGVRRLRAAVPPLPRSIWILNLGTAVNAVGSGLVTPFLLIYLHNVRGFSLELSGLVPTVHFATALVFGIAAGAAYDRIGGRTTAAVALVLAAVGFGLFPLVREPWQAFVLAAVSGVGRGAYWPAYSGLLAALTPPEQLPAAYAVQRVGGNLGIALGSLLAGLIVATSDPGTFTVVFVLSAATSVVFALSLLFVPPAHLPPAEQKAGRYADVLRDRTFVALIAVNFAFVAAGIALLNSVLPLFAKNNVGIDEKLIGLLFVVNTIAIVLLQFPVTRALRGRRRMQALAGMGAIWAFSWLIVFAAAGTSRTWLSAALLFVGVTVFAIGECIHGVVQGPLVSDLAPASIRGRYMASWLTTAQLGFALGPAVGAVMLDVSPAVLWIGAAAVCVLLGIAALALDERIPISARRSPEPSGIATGSAITVPYSND
jgi:MFS family permease